jgi:ribosomal protein S12 methylthiotransferase
LFRARHSGQCPEIDGMIIITDGRKVTKFGQLYEVEITDGVEYDLVGRVIGPVKESTKSCKQKHKLVCV